MTAIVPLRWQTVFFSHGPRAAARGNLLLQSGERWAPGVLDLLAQVSVSAVGFDEKWKALLTWGFGGVARSSV